MSGVGSDVRRLVGVYHEATNFVIQWVAKHSGTPLEFQKSAEGGCRVSLPSFHQAVASIASSKSTIPSELRHNYQLALDCRQHANRLLSQKERENTGSISTSTAQHAHFNQEFATAFKALFPSLPLATIKFDQGEVEKLRNQYAPLADLPNETLLGSTKDDNPGTQVFSWSFWDDTMQIVEIEVHTCKILCHVQDMMTQMAKVYQEKAKEEISWFQASWITSILAYDMSHWAGILEAICGGDLCQLDGITKGEICQRYHELHLTKASKMASPSRYDGIVSGKAIRVLRRTLAKYDEGLSASSGAATPTVKNLGELFPHHQPARATKGRDEAAADEAEEVEMVETLEAIFRMCVAHIEPVQEMLPEDYDKQRNMRNALRYSGQIQRLLYLRPSKQGQVDLLFTAEQLLHSSFAFLDCCPDPSTAMPYRAVHQFTSQIESSIESILVDSEAVKLFGGKQARVYKLMSGLASMCVSLRTEEPAEIGSKPLFTTPLVVSRFLLEVYTIVVDPSVTLANQGSVVAAGLYFYKMMQEACPGTLQRIPAFDVLCGGWKEHLFPYGDEETLGENWMRYHEITVPSDKDRKRHANRVPSTYNGGNRVTSASCTLWQYCDPSLVDDEGLRTDALEHLKTTSRDPKLYNKTFSNLKKGNIRLVNQSMVDVVRKFAAEELKPNSMGFVNMFAVFRLCFTLMETLGVFVLDYNEAGHKINALESLRHFCSHHWPKRSTHGNAYGVAGVQLLSILVRYISKQQKNAEAQGRPFRHSDQKVLHIVKDMWDYVMNSNNPIAATNNLFWQGL